MYMRFITVIFGTLVKLTESLKTRQISIIVKNFKVQNKMKIEEKTIC